MARYNDDTRYLPMALRPAPSESLGQALKAARERARATTCRMAMRLVIPHETYLALETDATLPTFAQLRAIGQRLERAPVYLYRMVRQTARIIIGGALQSAAPSRQRGGAHPDPLPRLNLPAVLRHVIADHLQTENDDAALAVRLHELAMASAAERVRAVEGMLAVLELEGEAAALAQVPVPLSRALMPLLDTPQDGTSRF